LQSWFVANSFTQSVTQRASDVSTTFTRLIWISGKEDKIIFWTKLVENLFFVL